MDHIGFHHRPPPPPQQFGAHLATATEVRSQPAVVVGMVRPRSLFESILVPPSTTSPFSATSDLHSAHSNGSTSQLYRPSSPMSTSTSDLMEFCSPSKKQRPDDVVDAASQRQQQYGWTMQLQNQKRKWDAVDEDEEEHEEGEEEQLNDSSDDEDEDHDEGKKSGRSRSSSSSSTVIVSFPASPDMPDKPAKHQRVVHKRPDARDIPRARHIILRFSDSGETVQAKIVCKEPWGVRVEVLEERSDLSLCLGTRYWARFTGTVSPVTNIPILEAMHPC